MKFEYKVLTAKYLFYFILYY